MSCIIKKSKDGLEVFTPTGEKSNLFENLKKLTTEENALDLVIKSYSEDFLKIKRQGVEEETTANDILAYEQLQNAEKTIVNSTDRTEIISFMQDRGIESLSQLETKLSKVFKPKGTFEIDTRKMVSSGLYSKNEAYSLVNDLKAVEKLQDTVNKVTGLVIKGENFFVNPIVAPDSIFKSNKKDSFGVYDKSSNTENLMEVFDTVKSARTKSEFEALIQTVPSQGIVEKFNTNKTFANNLYEDFKKFQQVPTIEISESTLTRKIKNNQESTLKATAIIKGEADVLLKELRDFLNIDLDIKQNNIRETKELVKEIEKLAIDYNIDVIGLSENNLQEINEIINGLANYVEKANRGGLTTVDIKQLADKLSEGVTDSEISFVKLPEEYRNLNIVKLFTELSPDRLFEEHGLIKVGENLYHRVDQNTDVDLMYNHLYKQRLRKGEIEPVDKPTELEELKSEISSKNIGLDVRNPINAEKIALFQEIFNHQPIEQAKVDQEIEELTSFNGDPAYLTTDFISDFYNYVLEEKLKDSQIYRDVLSKFVFNIKDISVNDIDAQMINNLRNIEHYEDLQNYIKLKKQDPIRLLIEPAIETGIVAERILAINDPNYLENYRGEYNREGDLIIAETSDDLIKINQDVYQKVGHKVFAKVSTTQSENYYTLDYELDFNQRDVNRVENKTKARVIPTQEEIADNLIGEKSLKNVQTYLAIPLKIAKLYSETKLNESINECR